MKKYYVYISQKKEITSDSIICQEIDKPTTEDDYFRIAQEWLQKYNANEEFISKRRMVYIGVIESDNEMKLTK